VDSEEAAISRDILGYLLDHPDSEDGVEGIAGWWVLERCVQRRVSEVGRALDELVRRRLVVRRADPAAGVRYRIDRDRLDEARRFVAGGRRRRRRGGAA
jgi:hypothetical protein